MDSLSQFVLGAAVGEACLGKKLGFKASVWGGLAATIPDLDFIIGNRLGVLQEITFHRGPSHSIFFALALTPILTFIALKMHKKKHSDLKFWDFSPLFFLALFTHSLLDCFTTWGTQLFWPFNLNRVALASISVVDPFYTFPLILCWFFAIAQNQP